MAFACLASGASWAQKNAKSAGKPAEKAADVPLDPQAAVQMANDYLNATRLMTADFIQVGADGREAEGKLYVVKPGRMRFEYALPATMEIIADGAQVAIRDRKLQSQQLYFINETPLKFLLKANIDLARDVKLTNVVSNERNVDITIEDKSTFGGVSTIKLQFDRKDFSLRQWRVTDPQGYQTQVSLHNVDVDSVPDMALFKIPPTSFWPH